MKAKLKIDTMQKKHTKKTLSTQAPAGGNGWRHFVGVISELHTLHFLPLPALHYYAAMTMRVTYIVAEAGVTYRHRPFDPFQINIRCPTVSTVSCPYRDDFRALSN